MQDTKPFLIIIGSILNILAIAVLLLCNYKRKNLLSGNELPFTIGFYCGLVLWVFDAWIDYLIKLH